MAIFYYRDFRTDFASSNFGDDINPFLMGNLFSRKLIDSEKVCIVGVGTLINDKNINKIQNFSKKIIFSSGVGYGEVKNRLDASWDLVCVRGPKSAFQLGVDPKYGIADGAILLSDYFPVIDSSQRTSGNIFIPHIRTHWAAGLPLKDAVESIGFRYVTPDLPPEKFIEIVSSSRLVVTEAMHGAILADTMRTPWIPINIFEHLAFKWEDWYESMGIEYAIHNLNPKIWNPPKNLIYRYLKMPYQDFKKRSIARFLEKLIDTATPCLSENDVLVERKAQLYEKIDYINMKYGL
ncbi:succinoglycan biosynthesis ketolase [Marinobacter santoriniensis NKSG1]|uniref:Succinoglycan biosynthesis ketolase n=1 Tax=Marinobacter santoriniensis NKSG1 TaxID=1288826 RepID=M7CPJ2_9GAMM|nr:polysaccharide pyruvyl transferase family protein [Marinobacter santoriniensis]EMP55576.1 succinoglycan biosynthesis ketolase [Marinobacter santoriniensis NKSG1]